jgi:hypothetical protein
MRNLQFLFKRTLNLKSNEKSKLFSAFYQFSQTKADQGINLFTNKNESTMLFPAISKLNIPSSNSKIKINGDDLAFIMTQTGGRPEFLYQPDFRPENASGEPYKDEEIGKMITLVEFFCMLIRKLGGADALRASLMQFEMREDGTIEREWLEDWIDYQTDQSLAWEIIEELGDGADIDSRGIVDIEQIISFIYHGMQESNTQQMIDL